MDLLNKEQRQKINRQLITCEHGINKSESCFWCASTANKPLTDRIDIIEQRFDALLGVLKLILKGSQMGGRPVLNSSTTIVQNITGNNLIQSGLDADKPNDNNIAFWMSTDTDTIYQRRDGTWIDISFSRPIAPDVRITEIHTDDATGTLEVTDTA
jgi:hypothetical protein